MDPILETLALYMKPIGVEAFAEAVHQAAGALEKVCRQVDRYPLPAVVERSGVVASGPLTGWTLPDALWLVACARNPALNSYPLGEIAERAFKRTVAWLAIYAGRSRVQVVAVALKDLQKNIREVIRRQGLPAALAFFLTEYLYEVFRDAGRRIKSGTEADPCYRYHFASSGRPRSLADEQNDKRALLRDCRQLVHDCQPALLESLDRNDPAPLEAEFARQYQKGLGRPPQKKKRKTHRKPPLNVVVGEKDWSALKRDFTLDPGVRRLLLYGKKANVSFDRRVLENLLADLPGRPAAPLHSLCKDLLDVGVAVYIADQAMKREITLKRRLDILLPVRHLHVWNEARDLLAETVAFLGRDEVHFHFIKKRELMNPVRFKVATGKRCVVLFSGGLDSAAGAVQVLGEGLDPVLISHHANAFTSGTQKCLLGMLNEGRPKPLDWLSLYVNKSHSKNAANKLKAFPDTLMTQFLRSFLFLSAAAVVAVEAGIGKVHIFENGPIALNPMFSEARLNTRTAHPRFLACFQALIRQLFKVPLEIENPFLSETKGEVAARLAAPDLTGLVAGTNSCWNAFLVPKRASDLGRTDYKRFHHDGDCLPCVIRRAALFHAALSQADVPYLVDIFNDYPRLKVKTRTLIADYLRFCLNLEFMDDPTLLLEHPDFSVCAPGVDPQALVAMYRRHAAEMVRSFQEFGSPRTAGLLLPPTR